MGRPLRSILPWDFPLSTPWNAQSAAVATVFSAHHVHDLFHGRHVRAVDVEHFVGLRVFPGASGRDANGLSAALGEPGLQYPGHQFGTVNRLRFA